MAHPYRTSASADQVECRREPDPAIEPGDAVQIMFASPDASSFIREYGGQRGRVIERLGTTWYVALDTGERVFAFDAELIRCERSRA